MGADGTFVRKIDRRVGRLRTLRVREREGRKETRSLRVDPGGSEKWHSGFRALRLPAQCRWHVIPLQFRYYFSLV